MGLSSSKTKSTTTPVYAPQLTQAAGNINSAYSSQAPKITAITDQLGTLVPGLLSQYTNGDPNVNAARSYNSDVLSGKYLNSNPYLQSIMDQTGNQVRNQTAAALGTRGLTGGSDFAGIIASKVAQANNTLGYNDYNTQMGRMDQAASLAPSLAAAQYLPLGAITDIAQSQQIPVQSAVGAGAGIGGLLGQYTNNTTKSSPNFGAMILQGLSNAAQSYAMGG